MKARVLTLLLLLSLVVPQPSAARIPLPSDPVPIKVTASPPAALQLSIAAAPPAPDPFPSALRSRFEPAFLKQLLSASADEVLRGIVMMHEQILPASVTAASTDPLDRRKAIVDRLRSVADRSQRSVRADLEQAHAEQRVVAFRPLWIVNGIAVEAREDVFWELASHPNVEIVLADHVRHLPIEDQAPVRADPGNSPAGDVQWNVQRVQADRVWQALEITGEGVVVANLDSGVDWQHPNLIARYRGYTGKPIATHDGNWYCATDEGYAYPGDGLGHGTHTMGTMVGEDGIGVAPGAQWIAVKVFDNQGVSYDSWIHDGFQWILAPDGDASLAPDVVNSSWGSAISAEQEFLPDVQALRAAGIFPVFAAGNTGPENGTIQAPGSFPESFAVGATDSQDRVAHFSSRGPSPWREVKPEVSAPGVSVVSAVPGGSLGTMSGTSMAAPHVAGLLALMRQANPVLTVEQAETILTTTALPLGDGHPNNDYGWGLVDGYTAVTRAGDFGQLVGQVTRAADGTPVPGARLQAISHAGTVTTTTTTDGFGQYAVGLSAGHFDVTVAAFGYEALTVYNVEVAAAATTTLDVALTARPTGELRGVIRETGTNLPLQAAVYVPGAPPTTTSSATSGAYSLVLPEGTHTVRAERAAHRFVTATVTITGGTSVQQDFALDPAPTILLVDSGAWYNDSQRAYYESALEGLRYLYDRYVVTKVTAPSTDVPSAEDLLPYDIVIWSAPQDAPGLIGASAAITNYLSGGGRLLLSGQDIAFWDGGGNLAFDAPYFWEYLKAWFVSDDAGTHVLAGQGALFAGLTITIAGAGGADNQLYPDVIASADRDYATSAWAYDGDGSGGQTVGPCLPYRVVFLSFGLEGIVDPAVRQEVMRRGMAWLSASPRPSGIELETGEMPQIELAGGWITHAVRLRNTGEVSTDTFSLDLQGGPWPKLLRGPPTLQLGACQSTTLSVSVTVPAGTGRHEFDTAVLTARSALSPGLTATTTLVSKTPAPVLLVDGARFFHFEDRYRAALDEAGIPFDYRRVKDVWPPGIPATETLSTYPVVTWYTAYDWYEPLSGEEQDRLIAYLDRGGRLFLSSQDYLYYSAGSPLARDYLGVLGHSEDLSATLAVGEPGHPIGWGLGPYSLTFPYRNWSDGLLPTPEARVAFRGQHGLPIGMTRSGGGWRTAFSAFPFETLDAGPAETTIARTVGWLSWLGSSSWAADRPVAESGSQVTMTCVLRNDGWAGIANARFSTTLPGALSLVAESLGPEATYHPLTRTVTWQGPLDPGRERTIRFRAQIEGSLADGSDISFPAYIGYDDHAISFERPYVLLVNAPDLSSSTLVAEPDVAHPWATLTYTLTLRNTGLREATVAITATPPSGAVFTRTLESGGVGSGDLFTDALSWMGPVPAGDEVVLRYAMSLGAEGEYWLLHQVWVQDQYGERRPIETLTDVRFWRAYLPLAR